MGKYVLKRLAYMVVVFFITSLMMYAIYNLIPNDPARAQLEGQKKTMKPEEYEEAYNNLREKMGLNDPLIVRYARWMGLIHDIGNKGFNGLLQGNFGYSNIYQKDVIDIIGAPMENTIILNIFATILTLAITIPLGIACAVKKGSLFDNATQVFTIVGWSLPTFIVAILFIYLFAVLIPIFPVGGAKTPGSNYVGLREFGDRMYYLALPILVSTFTGLAGMTRNIRASMIDTLSMDYIRTARAKGLKERTVIYSHAWRNALLPVVTSLIGWFLSIFGGSFVIENTFLLHGMGRLYIQALQNNDFELVLASQMFNTVVSLVGILITDLAYGLVDPRVRVDK